MSDEIPTEPEVEADLENGDANGEVSLAEALGVQRMSLQELKEKTPADLLAFAERSRNRKRELHAQAGHDVRNPEGPR